MVFRDTVLCDDNKSDDGLIFIGSMDAGVGVGSRTLGSCVSGCNTAGGDSFGSGMWSTWFNVVAISRSAFLTGSPARKEGTVVDGGCVRSVTISVAACFK